LAVVYIQRMQDGKIAEQWEVVQLVPKTTVSGNEVFWPSWTHRSPGPPRSGPWLPRSL
jgi:hypothetical protein